jgi:hypothetical protein
MNAKRIAFWSKVYRKSNEKTEKRRLKTYFKKRVKYAMREGKTFVRFFIEQNESYWKYVPEVAELLIKKGFKCSFEINERLDNDYDVTINWEN